nr:peroxidase 20 [Tanacetum cinerariifolium]
MNVVSVGVRFDGCFMHVPLRYQDGKKLILAIRRMAYEGLFEFLKNTVGFAHGLYYKVPNVKLETGLVRVSNAKELYYMFDVPNAYDWLEMYVDHHDMKLSQYLEAADTTIMDGVVAKWRGPPKTMMKQCREKTINSSNKTIQ